MGCHAEHTARDCDMKGNIFAALIFLQCCFSQSLTAQSCFDFEDENLSEWTQNPTDSWIIKDTAVLNSGKVLHHMRMHTGNAADKISTLPLPNKNAQQDRWKFTLKHGYTPRPSANNYWLAFLASNVDASTMAVTTSTNGNGVNAYAVGVYQSTGGDTLKLFKVTSGIAKPIAVLRTKVSNAILTVEVTRSKQGEWRVCANDTTCAVAADTAELPGEYFGFLYAFSRTAGQLFWVDSITVDVAFRPLQITSLQRKGARSLQLTLNKNVNTLSASDVSHYNLLRLSDGRKISVDSVKIISGNEFQLFVNQDFETNNYELKIAGLLDEHGMTNEATHKFALEVLRYGDIVFSELMVHPNSEGDLPEEYVEIYNRTDRAVSLEGFTLASPTRTGRITSGVVEAHGYAVIGSVPNMQSNVAITNRPTLADGGMNLTLRDSYGIPLSTLTYSDTWYADEVKKLGGWSLEKIDLNNLEENKNAWRASIDERGGTPEMTNSVAASNPDNAPPVCIGFKVEGSRVQLNFNEALSFEGDNVNAFNISDCGYSKDAVFTIESPTSISLDFPCVFEKHKIYRLRAENAVCDMSGNCIPNFDLLLGFGDKPNAGEVVINELLFNPNAGGVDFVELYNRSDKIAELQGCRIANRKLANDAIDRSYTLPAYTLLPNDYVVITTKPDVVREQYRCENPNAFISLSAMPSYANDAGCVALLNVDSTLLENFYYSEKMHSGALVNKRGVSLERINPNRAAGEEAGWLSAAQVVGFATPTYKNSQYSEHEFSSDDALSLYPEVFSPDGDGFDDVLFIGYKMPSEGYVANISIFTSAGKIAKTLCRNATLAVEGQLSWDGVCDNGKRADVGVYVVYVEAFSLDGKVNRYKKTCVVGARF